MFSRLTKARNSWRTCRHSPFHYPHPLPHNKPLPLPEINEPKTSSRLLWTIIGAGTVSATGYLLFPSYYTLHADSDVNTTTHTESPDLFVHPGGTPFLVPGTQRVDGYRVDCNYPNEDTSTLQFHRFSKTLGYLWIGIFDGHNGSYTSGQLCAQLSEAVMGSLVDLYSMHAEKNRTVDVANDMFLTNPGDPPDPVPSDEEIDETIRRVFVAYDDVWVHEMAQSVLGLDDAAYAALQANNSPDSDTPTSSPSQPTITSNPLHRKHETPLEDAVRKLAYAHSGSCALIGMYNIADRSLRVALTGDSRAVLGRRVPITNADGTQRFAYEVHPLSVDQNASNPTEAARLTALHPDEPALLKNNRVVGWGPSRAFGDASMKWSRAVQNQLRLEAMGSRPRDECKTPPYFTAEPVVTTEKDVRRGDFAVFATDGLWDCLTSEEVVGLVGQWLEERGLTNHALAPDGKMYEVKVPNSDEDRRQATFESSSSFLSEPQDGAPSPTPTPVMLHIPNQLHPPKTYLPADLPVIYPEGYKDSTTMYKYWQKEKNFVCKDENVAMHLARNALGGADKDLRRALLAMRMPRARRFRDDITIYVVFFD